LATVSPSGGQGNLGMTLWHELAHVFHIGLSNHRVPRWFTEGLAEWETKVRGVGWSRELDRELSITARAGNLPPLSRLSRAFTHAESHQDIASAYYASGLIAEWTVDSQGQSKVVSVLRELGQKRLFTDVFPEQLGQSWAQLDGEVEEFFQAHLSAMNAQFVSQTPTLSSPQLERALKKSPDDRQLRLMRAQYLLAAGQVQAAHEMLTRLDAVNYDAQVSFSLARIALSEKRFADVDRRLSKMVAHGDDGYEVRLAWGSSLMLQKKATQAISQLQKAAHFDPGATEPLQLLSRLFAERSHQEQELVVVHRLAQLSEHEPGPHRRLMELLLEAKREKEAAQAAELAIWVDLADSSLHRLAGQSFARAGDLSRAQFEWESALLTVKSAGELRDLGEVWQAELVRVGRNKEARDVAARIEKTLSQ
jgi:tetratricopeptide (TPR) repeat protein